MTNTKEDQMRAEFEQVEGAYARAGDGYYHDNVNKAWGTWKACAESYEKKLAEKDAEIAQHLSNIVQIIRDDCEKLAEKETEIEGLQAAARFWQDKAGEANAQDEINRLNEQKHVLAMKLEVAEQAIRESQEQGSVVWMQSTHLDKFIHKACGADSMLAKSSGRKLMSDYIPLYTKPVIILQSAEQLYIKELRDDVAKLRYMIYMGATTAALFDIADKALAKQPDTHALEKALLEVEIKVLCEAYDSCKPYGVEFLYMMTERNEKLAELNKE